MIQLPLAATEPLHEIHLRLLQKVPGLQSRLWTRPQCRLRRQSLRPRARVRLGRMLKLQRNRPPDNLPVPHSTSPGRCWRSQTETSDKQWSGSLPFHRPFIDPGDADTQVLWRESLIKCTATTKPPLMPRETRHPFMSVPRLTWGTRQCPFTAVTARLTSLSGLKS